MISIQSAMLVALGFLAASLMGLLLASAFWSRAVRLTTRRLKASLPVSEPEIKADLDRLRASYAIRVHKLEIQLEQARLERARQLIEINRRDASISALETGMVAIKAELDENQNARRVLEQTVADRLPKVEARLTEAKRLLSARDQEIAELAQGARRHRAALEEASSINAQRSAEIERLNSVLAAKGGRRRRSDGTAETEGEVALRAEAEALRTKTREQSALIDRLQRRLGEGFPMAAAPASANGAGGPGAEPAAAGTAESQAAQMGRVRENLSEAEQTLRLARAGVSAESERVAGDREKEVRVLKARIEDQAGEIARLKAALAVFEQPDDRAGLGNSRLALKARAGSAEAQAERQAATIAKLRAELAAANERLAQQAAHFMEEMRRIGTGAMPASGPARRPGRDGQRRRVAERVEQVPTRRPEPVGAAASQAAVVDGPATAGQAPANGGEDGARDAQPPLAPAATVAAEMPQTATIPAGERRRMSLLDRITGIGKG